MSVKKVRVRLPENLKKQLAEEAKRTVRKESGICTVAIEKYIDTAKENLKNYPAAIKRNITTSTIYAFYLSPEICDKILAVSKELDCSQATILKYCLLRYFEDIGEN